MHLWGRDQPRRSLPLFLGAGVQGCRGARVQRCGVLGAQCSVLSAQCLVLGAWCLVLVLVWCAVEIFCQTGASRFRSLCQSKTGGQLRFVHIAALVTIDQEIGNFLQ